MRQKACASTCAQVISSLSGSLWLVQAGYGAPEAGRPMLNSQGSTERGVPSWQQSRRSRRGELGGEAASAWRAGEIAQIPSRDVGCNCRVFIWSVQPRRSLHLHLLMPMPSWGGGQVLRTRYAEDLGTVALWRSGALLLGPSSLSPCPDPEFPDVRINGVRVQVGLTISL